MFLWGGSLKEYNLHKCKHTNANKCTPHCDHPALLVIQTVGPSKAPFRGNGGSRRGGGRGSDEDSTQTTSRMGSTLERGVKRLPVQWVGTKPAVLPHFNLPMCLSKKEKNTSQMFQCR